MHAANSGAVSAKVQNSTTSSNSQHGIAVYDDTDDTFEVDLGGGSMGSVGNNVLAGNTLEDLAIEYDGRTLAAQNNWWGQASGPDTDDPSVGIAPQIYYGAPINDGLVGHWTFDTEWTTNTTAYDRSGNGNDGTLNGGLSLADQVTGQNGEALDFVKADTDYIDAGSDASISNTGGKITVVANVYLDNNDTFQTIVSNARDCCGVYDGINYVYRYGGQQITARLWNSTGASNSFQDPTAITAGQWVQLAFTYDDAQLIHYRDAVADAPIAGVNSLGAPASSSLKIGRLGTNATHYFDGKMDDVKIYNDALTSNQISELYRMDTSSVVNTGSFLTAAP